MQSLIRNGLELFETDIVYQRGNFAKQTSKLVRSNLHVQHDNVLEQLVL